MTPLQLTLQQSKTSECPDVGVAGRWFDTVSRTVAFATPRYLHIHNRRQMALVGVGAV